MAILTGVLKIEEKVTLTYDQGTIEVIMLLVGLWWLIEGLFNLLAIFIDRSKWGWKLFSGVLGVIAGLLVLNFPLVGGAVYFSVMVIIMKLFNPIR